MSAAHPSASKPPRQNSHNVHLEGLPPKIKALTDHYPANAGGMAFSHHELSVENAVIPFSLSPPTRFSRTGPVTFEMEHSHR
ncbi:hypothetical protein FJD35_10970 [Pseudomonas mandelii]|nr:hypothetical protein FJD35_10970 [Pseudomonas mandelii]